MLMLWYLLPGTLNAQLSISTPAPTIDCTANVDCRQGRPILIFDDVCEKETVTQGAKVTVMSASCNLLPPNQVSGINPNHDGSKMCAELDSKIKNYAAMEDARQMVAQMGSSRSISARFCFPCQTGWSTIYNSDAQILAAGLAAIPLECVIRDPGVRLYQESTGKWKRRGCPPGMGDNGYHECVSCKKGRAQMNDPSGKNIGCQQPLPNFRLTRKLIGEPFVGATMNENTEMCAFGFASNGINQDVYKCQTCPPGSKYVTPSVGCRAPDAGKFLDPATGDFESCPAGKFSTYYGEGKCRACPPGTISGRGAAYCFAIPAGHQTLDGITTEPCPRGKYAPFAATPSCLQCPDGQHADEPGNTECTCVPAGHIPHPDDKFALEPLPCNPGEYQPKFCVAEQECQDCKQGTYWKDMGARECSCTAAGSHTNALRTGQDLCDAGTFSVACDEEGCQDCSPGTFNRIPGGSCERAWRGYYVPGNKATKPTKCPLGTAQPWKGQKFCYVCGWYEWSWSTASLHCIPCMKTFSDIPALLLGMSLSDDERVDPLATTTMTTTTAATGVNVADDDDDEDEDVAIDEKEEKKSQCAKMQLLIQIIISVLVFILILGVFLCCYGVFSCCT